MKRVQKRKRKSKSVSTRELINLKVSRKEKKSLLERAQKYAGGNLSKWLRHAGSKHTTAVPRSA